MAMSNFDTRSHARLVGNVLVALGASAFAIALADFIPDRIFALPAHFFGSGGAAIVGLLLLVTGLLMRK